MPPLELRVRNAPGATASCEAAHKLHDVCSWGSSGDAGFSGIVIEKM
jgi:hypothetical protein